MLGLEECFDAHESCYWSIKGKTEAEMEVDDIGLKFSEQPDVGEDVFDEGEAACLQNAVAPPIVLNISKILFAGGLGVIDKKYLAVGELTHLLDEKALDAAVFGTGHAGHV